MPPQSPAGAGARGSSLGEHKIVRRVINDSNFKKKYTLPKAVTNWRIVNEGTTEIKWATNDRPPDDGENAWSLLPGRSADCPPISPAHEGAPVELWMANANAGESVTVTIIYTTSTDPSAIAQFSNVNLGLNTSDIELGAVELKDGSGDQRVTITSGPDGKHYIETDASGSALILTTSGLVQVSVQSGNISLRGFGGTSSVDTITLAAPQTTLLAKSVALETASIIHGFATYTNPGNGMGAVVNVLGNIFFPDVNDGGLATIAGIYGRLPSTGQYLPVAASSGWDGITRLETRTLPAGFLLGGISSVAQAMGQSGAAVVGGVQFGGTSATPMLVDSSGRSYVQVWSGNLSLAQDGTLLNFRRWGGIPYIAQAPTMPAALAVAAEMWGLDSNLNGVTIQVTSGPDGVRRMEVKPELLTLGGTAAVNPQGSTSGIQYVAPIADMTQGMVYSGIVTWSSGNAANTVAQIGIAPLAVRDVNGYYVISVHTNALSSDVTVRVNNIRAFGSLVLRPEITRFTVTRGTSGAAAVVQGLFAGGTSGELVLLNDQAAIEPISAFVVVSRI